MLEIGGIVFSHVDIGEVWVAGGQSNMEFLLQYSRDGEAEAAVADDEHFCMYTVGQYSFKGEREEGYKAWNPWDKWFSYLPAAAGNFSATAVYFAKELRKQGIPVGILNCSWGGTSASTWIEKSYLLADERLRCYVDEFDAAVEKLDLERYYAIKKMVRPGMAAREAKAMMSVMLKQTFRPGELEKMMMAGAAQQTDRDNKMQSHGGFDFTKLSIEEITAVGPEEPNEPGTLYENMVKEIVGYSTRGVIWYQGETDESHPDIYAVLFGAMITCWRNNWYEKNPAQKRLPILFVQLAPYGTWRMNTGEVFPVLRAQQELVEKTVTDTHMASISDVGNVFDIHPKDKKPVGERLALLARKYVYGEQNVMADAPEAQNIQRLADDTVCITFQNAKGLYKEEKNFDAYNGFSVTEIPEEFIPPVFDGVNALCVYADGKRVESGTCSMQGETLLIRSDELRDAKKVRVEFANMGFYEVNLYNEAGLPVKPFVL